MNNRQYTSRPIKEKKVSPDRRMTSIARRINGHYWLQRFFGLLILDIIIVVIFYFCYCYWKGIDYTAFFSYDAEAWFRIGDEMRKYLMVPGIVLGSLELIYLIFSLNDIQEVRRSLKPLNDLAVKAENLSRIDYDAAIANLGHMIDDISPDALDEGISTGDKDLQSIEVALNSLLYRMRENQKQQSRFVSDASHELRTPIAVIQGYVNMLDRWGKEDESVLTEAIEALKNESEHMKTLVEQLLFLARGDNGRNTLNKVEFDLNEVMRDVYEESLMIDDKHPYVFTECPGTMMVGDIAMIKQSMRIFIQNAAKYSSQGDTISLKVTVKDDRPAYIVQDEGIGMQQSDVAHIFERFYRADSARNSESGGTGLGLSIAKWIVDAHAGEITVLSRKDFGTRFTVTF